MIYRFRVILDTKEDVFRDIEIHQSATLEDFNNAITQSFGFDGMEMASFYLSNDTWEQGEEISQFDVSEGMDTIRLMSETLVEDVVNKSNTKLLYVYDFLSMWRFMIELAEIAEPEDTVLYPNLMFVQGQVPDRAPEVSFEAEKDEFHDGFEDDMDIDDLDNQNFDQNWDYGQ